MGRGHCSLSLEFGKMAKLIIYPESSRETKGTWVPASTGDLHLRFLFPASAVTSSVRAGRVW